MSGALEEHWLTSTQTRSTGFDGAADSSPEPESDGTLATGPDVQSNLMLELMSIQDLLDQSVENQSSLE